MDYSGQDNVRELNVLLEKQIMIRRLKQDVLAQLPPKSRQKVELEVAPAIVKKIQAILRTNEARKKSDPTNHRLERFFERTDMLDFDSYLEGASKAAADEDSSYMQAYSLTAEAKVEGVVAFVDTLLQNEVKTIVFAHHFSMLDALEAYAVKKNVGFVRIDGSVNANARHEAVNSFQENSEVLLAILSLTACATGLTLTASSTVVFAEFSWTPGVMK